MARYNSRAEFENEANKKKAKELRSKQESEERARKAKEELDKKRNAQKLKGDDGVPTDPVGDPADPIGGGDPLPTDPIDLAVPGCMDPLANNYNSFATFDDGSCDYSIIVVGLSVPGCTDPTASNYNSLATYDDGSCIYCIYGCMTPQASNYDPLATCDDGSCIIDGCMDPSANNYNPLANTPDNKCFWDGCTDPTASNYVGLPPPNGFSLFPVTGNFWNWQSAITGDGGFVNPVVSCRYDKVRGCTDINAINYDPLAVVDDGSCIYSGCTDPNANNYDSTLGADCLDNIINSNGYVQLIGWDSCCTYDIKGCTDPAAFNYNPAANVDDGSCIYEGCTNASADNYDANATIDDGSCEWYGCTDPLADNYSFPGSSVDGPNGIFTYLTGNAVDDGSCTYDNPRDPCYQIGDITIEANGGGGGMVFALPNTTSNPTPFYFEVSLVDLSTGGTPISHYKDILVSPVTQLDDVPNACGLPSLEAPIHNFNSPWFQTIDISIPNNQFRWGFGAGSFQPLITTLMPVGTLPPINQPIGVNIGDPAEAVDSNNHPLFNSPTTIIDIELIPAGVNVTSTGQSIASLLYDSYLFTFSQPMVAPPLSQPIKILTTGGILIGGPFTSSGAEWGAYNEPLSGLPIFFDEGRNNTDQIVNYPALPVWPTHTTAAKLCDDYITNTNGNDWFLPSLDEFDLMYKKLGPGTPHAAALNLTIGVNTSEMMDDIYWTSSDALDGGPFGAGFYFAQAYSTNPGPWSSTIGTPIPVGPVAVTRCSSLSVRAIRKFKCKQVEPLDPDRFGWTDANVKNAINVAGVQQGRFRSLLTPGAMGSGFGSIDADQVGFVNPGLGNNLQFEGVIGLPRFSWQPCTTDVAGNIWSLNDYDDANNPNGYTFKVWDADQNYLGTWHYQNCISRVKNRNWIRDHATDNGQTVRPYATWYDAIPDPDDPTELTSTTFPDKLNLEFENVTYIDTPVAQVVCYGFSYRRADGSNSNLLRRRWGGNTGIINTNNALWADITNVAGLTTNHNNYFNEYTEYTWLGFTASFAFIQMDSDMALLKPNAQPNVFSSPNNIPQQKMVVCAKDVFDSIRLNQSTYFNNTNNNLAGNCGGYIGIGGYNPSGNTPTQNLPPGSLNTTYGWQTIPGDQGLPQRMDRFGGGNHNYPKHHFHPWFADYPPPPNSGLQLFDNLQDGINQLNNYYDPDVDNVCLPHTVGAIRTGSTRDFHTWSYCSFEDVSGNVYSGFVFPWLAGSSFAQGPLAMDYLGASSTGDDFYNDVVTTLNLPAGLIVGNVVEIDVSAFGFVVISGIQVTKITLEYRGVLSWSDLFIINGIPGQPTFTWFNSCGSSLGVSLTDPTGTEYSAASSLSIDNIGSRQLQLKDNFKQQNVISKKPLKIITYISGIPLYSKIQDAVDWGYQYGLEGYHTHEYKSMIGYMAGESHEQSIKATEGQVIPQAVLESYQPPEQTIVPQQQYIDPVETPEPPMQQTPPPTPPTSKSKGSVSTVSPSLKKLLTPSTKSSPNS